MIKRVDLYSAKGFGCRVPFQLPPIDIGVGSSAYCSDLPLKYKTAYPESTVNRIYFDRAALIEALKSNEVDFGICSPAISADEADDLNTEILRDESAYLLAPVGHTISQQESVCVDDLNGLALITTLKGSDTRNILIYAVPLIM